MTTTEQIPAARHASSAQPERSASTAARTVLIDWLMFAIGAAVLVFCAFMVKDMVDWNARLGNQIVSFLVLFVLMVIAGKLMLPRVDKAFAWARTMLISRN